MQLPTQPTPPPPDERSPFYKTTVVDILLECETTNTSLALPCTRGGAVMRIPCCQIQAGDIPNRHSQSYQDGAFEQLTKSIGLAGGNEVPILLQPVPRTPDGIQYQIISGERRWRVCRDAHLDVRAIISADTSASEIFFAMLRENQCRAPLSPWETGRQAKFAMQAGLCKSLSILARELGCSKSRITEAVQLASLPEAVLVGFQSPNDLRHRDAKPLTDAVKNAFSEVSAEALRIRDSGEKIKSREVIARLLKAAGNCSVRPSNTSEKIQLDYLGEEYGHLLLGKDGHIQIALDKPLDATQREALIDQLKNFYKHQVLKIGRTMPTSAQEFE